MIDCVHQILEQFNKILSSFVLFLSLSFLQFSRNLAALNIMHARRQKVGLKVSNLLFQRFEASAPSPPSPLAAIPTWRASSYCTKQAWHVQRSLNSFMFTTLGWIRFVNYKCSGTIEWTSAIPSGCMDLNQFGSIQTFSRVCFLQ